MTSLEWIQNIMNTASTDRDCVENPDYQRVKYAMGKAKDLLCQQSISVPEAYTLPNIYHRTAPLQEVLTIKEEVDKLTPQIFERMYKFYDFLEETMRVTKYGSGSESATV